MANLELAHFIPDPVAMTHITNVLDLVKISQTLHEGILPLDTSLTFATSFVPYSTVRPIHLIELAKMLRPKNAALVRQDTFMVIDVNESHVYQLHPSMVFQYSELVAGNSEREWGIFREYSEYKSHYRPTIDLLTLGYGLDYLSDTKISSFADYISQLLHPKSLLTAVTHATHPHIPFAAAYQKRVARKRGVPIPVYPRPLNKTIELMDPLTNYVTDYNPRSYSLAFGLL